MTKPTRRSDSVIGRELTADEIEEITRQHYLWELAQCEIKFQSGDRMALLAAIRKCANHDLVMPPWVAEAFISAYDNVLNCRVGSWDEAFGAPYPKSSRLHKLRRDRTLRFAIWNAVQAALREEDPPPAINQILFERIGQKVHPPVGKTEASRLYYEAKNMLVPKKKSGPARRG